MHDHELAQVPVHHQRCVLFCFVLFCFVLRMNIATISMIRIQHSGNQFNRILMLNLFRGMYLSHFTT